MNDYPRREWVREQDSQYQNIVRERTELVSESSSEFRSAGAAVLEYDAYSREKIAALRTALAQEPVREGTVEKFPVLRYGETEWRTREDLEYELETYEQSVREMPLQFFSNLVRNARETLFVRGAHKLDWISLVSGLEEFLFSDPASAAELDRVAGEPRSPMSEYLERLVERASSDTTLSETIIRMIRSHQERVAERRRETERMVDETIRTLTDAVERAVDDGWLPPSALASLPRLGSVRVILLDTLVKRLGSEFANAHGTDSIIELSGWTRDPRARAFTQMILTHEFLHVLSGKNFELFRTNHEYAVQGSGRMGLQLQSNGGGRWLNEAVTQRLALRLFGDTQAADRGMNELVTEEFGNTVPGEWVASIYPGELGEFDRLISLGVDERLVYEAYFENASGDTTTQERGPAYKRMIAHIRETVGANEIIRVENRFDALSVAGALGSHVYENVAGINWSTHPPNESAPEDPDGRTLWVDVAVGSAALVAHARMKIVARDSADLPKIERAIADRTRSPWHTRKSVRVQVV